MPKAESTQQSNAERIPRSRRAGVSLVVAGRRLGEGPTRIDIMNISSTGMLMRTNALLTEGESFEATFPGNKVVQGIVVWANEDLFGCKFDRTLSAGMVASVLLKGEPGGRSGASSSNDDMRADLPRQLADYRDQHGLTLDDVAARLGVSRQAVWYWESGRSAPHKRHEKALHNLFDSAVADRVPAPGEFARLVSDAKDNLAECLGIHPQDVRILIER